MPRVNVVKSARRDYPEAEIRKGDTYYWWKFRYGGKIRSLTPPRRSQLTRSEFLATIYEVEDSLSRLDISVDVVEEVESIILQLEELRDEQEEKRENMPEGLQESPVAELLTGRSESVEAMIDAIQSVDLERWGEDEDETTEAREQILTELQDIAYDGE